MHQLLSFELLSKMPESVLREIWKHHSTKQVRRSEVIYRAGDVPKYLYLLEKGLVGLVFFSEKGTEHLLRIFGRGQFFGHRSVIAEQAHHATAIALENSHLICIPAHCVLSAIKQNPEASLILMKRLAFELGQAEIKRVNVIDADVESRVASALVYIQSIDQDHHWTRKEIADFIGSTGPTVTKTLLRFRKLGWIEFHSRKIVIRDHRRLLDLCGEFGSRSRK
ncbi:MAG TPA: Crp/Fnr family transcriptional regulator, partial [Pseudobdellovibrionaceae bacterium]|nr:Crp/Fnr family transcriptional regulator [Pseudobdellovibrionaceae bacterium]